MGIQTTPKTPTSLSMRIQYYDGSAWYDMTGTELQALMEAAGAATYQTRFITQYETPSSADTVSVTDGDDNIFLLITPTGTLSSLTIKLPASPSSVADGQEVKGFCTQQITTLSFDGNGASNVLGAPATLAVNGSFQLRYDAQNRIWYDFS